MPKRSRVPCHHTIVSRKALHIKVTVGLFGLRNRNDPLDSQRKNANKQEEA